MTEPGSTPPPVSSPAPPPPPAGQPAPPTRPAAPGPAGPDRGPRRLRRSREDRMLGGVCGGIARHLDVDPVLLRIATVALALSGGAGVLAYIVAWIVIPETAEGEEEPGPAAPASRHTVSVAVGAALVLLGALLLLRQWLPGFGANAFWPLVVVAAGVLLLVSARRSAP